MGRAHSNAYLIAPHAISLPLQPVLRAACGRHSISLEAFAARYGWQTTETSWERLVARDDIQIIDICTPNATHAPIAIAAARAGKHVICEKPLSRNAVEARQMLNAVREAGVCNMVAFNYRRVPAIAFAKQMIQGGRLGAIRHFNAVYYQDWLVDPTFRLTWRHDIEESGSGAHGDMNAHIVDLARCLVGEIEAVAGVQAIFIKARPFANGDGTGPVTADDATSFLARFRNGAMGSFQVTRLATGRKNYLRLEIFGSEGSLAFNLERLNELEFYSAHDDRNEQGYRSIIVSEPTHPYLAAWWPPGHALGWEHTFTHEIGDFLCAIGAGSTVQPDFEDGLRCQQVLDAVLQSARDERWTSVPLDD
jgi:predicted dehydrogenase